MARRTLAGTNQTFTKTGQAVSPWRQWLRNYAAQQPQTLRYYRPKYCETAFYGGVDLRTVTFAAGNRLHAYYMLFDFINNNCVFPHPPTDAFEDAFEDDTLVDEWRDANGDFQPPHYFFDNNTLWLDLLNNEPYIVRDIRDEPRLEDLVKPGNQTAELLPPLDPEE